MPLRRCSPNCAAWCSRPPAWLTCYEAPSCRWRRRSARRSCFGSVANQQDTAQSDIDVLVVSASLGYGELFGALETATAALGRTVNPTLYTPDELAQRRLQDNAFVTRVLNKPKLWLIGNEEALHG